MAQIFESLGRTRRFYSGVSVAPTGGGVAVLLDGRTPRSPAHHPLVFPTTALARLIADEWSAQTDSVNISAMPATRLAHTALDAIPAARAETAASVAEVAASDLLCYFAEHPASLVIRQHAVWTPLLAWAREELGLEFETTAGIVHRDQPTKTLNAVQALGAELDDFALAGVALAASLFNSAVVALALARGRVTGAQAFAASQLEEDFQAETWGVDNEAAARAALITADAVMLEAWFRALAEL